MLVAPTPLVLLRWGRRVVVGVAAAAVVLAASTRQPARCSLSRSLHTPSHQVSATAVFAVVLLSVSFWLHLGPALVRRGSAAAGSARILESWVVQCHARVVVVVVVARRVFFFSASAHSRALSAAAYTAARAEASAGSGAGVWRGDARGAPRVLRTDSIDGHAHVLHEYRRNCDAVGGGRERKVSEQAILGAGW